MERMTQKTGTGYELTGDMTEAAVRLGRFEDMAFGLEEEQRQISEQLAQLRDTGKERTTKFRELMAKKLANTGVLLALERFGCWETGR